MQLKVDLRAIGTGDNPLTKLDSANAIARKSHFGGKRILLEKPPCRRRSLRRRGD